MKSSVGRRQCARTPTEVTSRPGRLSRRDSGYTLIEVIITIALMGTVVVAVLSSVQVGITSSVKGRQLAQTQTVMLNIADHINRVGKSCDDADYRAAVTKAIAIHWPEYNGVVDVVVQHYVPAAGPPQVTEDGTVLTLQNAGTWDTGPCRDGVLRANEAQLVTVTLIHPDGGFTRKIEVVKSDA